MRFVCHSRNATIHYYTLSVNLFVVVVLIGLYAIFFCGFASHTITFIVLLVENRRELFFGGVMNLIFTAARTEITIAHIYNLRIKSEQSHRTAIGMCAVYPFDFNIVCTDVYKYATADVWHSNTRFAAVMVCNCFILF